MSETTKKKRVLYVLWTYPQLSQTYIQNEIDALAVDYQIRVVALSKPNVPVPTDQDYTRTRGFKRLLEEVRAFAPDVMHAHWLNMSPVMYRLARKTGIPYTIRAHSFDVLGHGYDAKGRARGDNPLARLANYIKAKPTFTGYRPSHVARYLNDPACLGALVFPPFLEALEKEGINPAKLKACYPVIDYQRFHDPAPNGSGVMNVGACIAKKRMEDFVDLGARLPGRAFRLYAIGYATDQLVAYNEDKGSPIEIVKNTTAKDMPAEYKKHQWLVYTASRDFNSVGWPMAVAEAQASGVGVCLPNIRPDLQTYLGEAGHLYDSIDEVAEIVTGEVPPKVREAGFAQAKKSDIRAHKTILEDLWAAA